MRKRNPSSFVRAKPHKVLPKPVVPAALSADPNAISQATFNHIAACGRDQSLLEYQRKTKQKSVKQKNTNQRSHSSINDIYEFWNQCFSPKKETHK